MPILETCVDDAEGMAVAIAAGADRIELCSALGLGGLTPSAGLMALAAQAGVPVHAMIRPRPGDFCFGAGAMAQMLAEIDAVRAAGLAGVVLGVSLADGRLDGAALASLCARAEGLDLTLHRAFDLVPNFAQALDLAVSLGFDRILSSGGAPRAEAGLEPLAKIAALAQGRIAIMPGGGVSAANAARLLALPGVTQLHARGGVDAPPASAKVLELGFDLPGRRQTSASEIAALRRVMDAATV